MNFLQLIRRFVPPYKGLMALNILFNLLSTVLSLFSFAAIIPVLQLLFGLSEAGAVYTDLETVSGMNATINALKGNLYLLTHIFNLSLHRKKAYENKIITYHHYDVCVSLCICTDRTFILVCGQHSIHLFRT